MKRANQISGVCLSKQIPRLKFDCFLLGFRFIVCVLFVILILLVDLVFLEWRGDEFVVEGKLTTGEVALLLCWLILFTEVGVFLLFGFIIAAPVLIFFCSFVVWILIKLVRLRACKNFLANLNKKKVAHFFDQSILIKIGNEKNKFEFQKISMKSSRSKILGLSTLPSSPNP